MKITTKIAWRNIWRNPRRTWVLVTSIAIGILGFLGTSAFSRGFLEQMVESTINLSGGHVTINARGYQDNPQVRFRITLPEQVEAVLQKAGGVTFAPLISLQGMINSSETAAGVQINGIDPDKERQITVIAKSIVAGTYLSSGNGAHEIVIGNALAQKLNVSLGEKIVLMISDLNNELNSSAFRVIGVYQTASSDFEKRFVYIDKHAAQTLAGYADELSSISIRLHEGLLLEETVENLQQALADKNLEILSWKERNPLLLLSLEMYDASVVIVAIIMFIAIAFTIANSFIMVIYERIQEFGIMIANGVLPKRIRRMLYAEALFITAIGALLGFATTGLLVGYYSRNGLDLSNFAQGLAKFGLSAVVYPEIWAFDVMVGLVGIVLVVFLSVLYPAIKASRFEVVDAIHFV